MRAMTRAQAQQCISGPWVRRRPRLRWERLAWELLSLYVVVLGANQLGRQVAAWTVKHWKPAFAIEAAVPMPTPAQPEKAIEL